MPLPRLDRAIVVLLSVALLFAPALGCGVRPCVREAAPPAPRAGGASVLVDLTGVGQRHMERPAGIDVAFRNLETGAVTRVATAAGQPVRVADLPPGDYEVALDGRPLGGPGVQRASFTAEPGARLALEYRPRGAAIARALEAARDDGAAVCVVLGVVALVGIGVALAAHDRDTARAFADGWRAACGCGH